MKAFKVERMVTTSSSGRSMGRVTFVSRAHFPAPSMLALSYSSPGMVVRPASRMTTPIPTFFQRYSPRRMTKAKGESIQGVGPVIWLKRPFSAKTRLTTITMADTGSTMGNNSAKAKGLPHFPAFCSSRARNSDKGRMSARPQARNRNVFFSAKRNRRFPKSWA